MDGRQTELDPSESRLGDVLAMLIESAERGERLDRSGWLAGHPEFVAELNEYFDSEDRINSLAAPLRAAVGADTPGPGNPRFKDLDPPGHSGQCVADYEVLEEIGRGGMGVVYKAKQKSANRIVALKVLRTDSLRGDDPARRFRNEAETVAGLDHPNIVPLYEVGEHLGRVYFSMKLIEGRSLVATISNLRMRNGDWQKESARLVATVARAVHHMHQHGVLHRDLKPANILLGADGQPYVTDFGLAKREGRDASLTETGAILGTPGYLAPEQAAGKGEPITVAADVYGLGAVLYALLTGRPPFQGETILETLNRVREGEPEPPTGITPSLDRDLETICLKCLRKEPWRRYGSAGEVAEDLERYRAGRPIKARRVSRSERVWMWCRRNRLVAGLTAATMLLLVLAVVGLSVANLLITREQGKTQWEKEQTDAALQLAHEREAGLRRHLYVADMRTALMPQKDANYESVMELLNRQVPQAGQEDLRGFEWHYLDRLCHSSRKILLGHRRDIVYVAFNKAGDQLASASEDGTIKLWDPASGKLLDTLEGNGGDVNWVSYSPDGALLVSAHDDKNVRLWDVRSRRIRATLKGHGGRLVAAEFSPNGKLIASGGEDNVIRLWDPATEKVVTTLPGHPGRIEALAFAPDGKTLASAATVSTNVILWDVLTGTKRLILDPGPGNPPCAVAISPDSRLVAAGGKDGIIRLWDTATGVLRTTLTGHQPWVQSIAFSPDGKSLASGGDDRIVRVWDLNGGSLRVQYRGHFGRIWCVRYSPDGKTLATSSRDGTVRLWEVGQQEDRQVLSQGSLTEVLAFAPDSACLATNSRVVGKGDRVKLWDCTTGSFQGEVAVSPRIHALAFSPDGQLLASNLEQNAYGVVDLWAMPGRQKLLTIPASGFQPQALKFLPDSRSLLIYGRQGHIERRDVTTGRLVQKSLHQEHHRGKIVFSPDGRLTMVHGHHPVGQVEFWDLTTGLMRSGSRAHSTGVVCLVFSPDGATMASGAERTILLWDPNSGQPGQTLSGHESDVTALGFSPDGKTLVSGDAAGFIKLWHVATGREMYTEKAYPRDILAVAFSPDGRMLVTSGLTAKDTGAVHLWRAAAPPGPP